MAPQEIFKMAPQEMARQISYFKHSPETPKRGPRLKGMYAARTAREDNTKAFCQYSRDNKSIILFIPQLARRIGDKYMTEMLYDVITYESAKPPQHFAAVHVHVLDIVKAGASQPREVTVTLGYLDTWPNRDPRIGELCRGIPGGVQEGNTNPFQQYHSCNRKFFGCVCKCLCSQTPAVESSLLESN